MKDLFVTGTGTGVGKTVLSALLASALDAAYWKPIQTGRMPGEMGTDRQTVMQWADLPEARAPAESHVFDAPVSPHLAARQAGVEIDLDRIHKPPIGGAERLIVEGAGGVMVPINARQLMLDLMARLDVRIVVASLTSLGTINHTLLSVGTLRDRGLDVLGVVVTGEENVENRKAIEHYGQVPVIGWIPPLETIDRRTLADAFARHFDRASFR